MTYPGLPGRLLMDACGLDYMPALEGWEANCCIARVIFQTFSVWQRQSHHWQEAFEQKRGAAACCSRGLASRSAPGNGG